MKTENEPLTYALPSPIHDGKMSVERAITNRRSRRQLTDEALTVCELSQIMWAAYGVTKTTDECAKFVKEVYGNDLPDVYLQRLRGGWRTAPSAGCGFPFEIYVSISNVEGIEPGVYKYISAEHKLVRTIATDVRAELEDATMKQEMVKYAPMTVIYSAIFSRMTKLYGDRGRLRYVAMDLGHSAQNIHLQAEALELGTCAIGAFLDDDVSRVLQLPEIEEPLYLMPVGRYKL